MSKQFKPNSATTTETQVIPEIIDSIKYGITNNLLDKNGYGIKNQEILGGEPVVSVYTCSEAAALIQAGAENTMIDDLHQRCSNRKDPQ